MLSVVFAIVYAVIGMGAGAAVLIQRRAVGRHRGFSGAVWMMLLWPFLLPAAWLSEPPLARRAPRSAHGERLDELSHRLEELLGPARDARQRAAVESFV